MFSKILVVATCLANVWLINIIIDGYKLRTVAEKACHCHGGMSNYTLKSNNYADVICRNNTKIQDISQDSIFTTQYCGEIK